MGSWYGNWKKNGPCCFFLKLHFNGHPIINAKPIALQQNLAQTFLWNQPFFFTSFLKFDSTHLYTWVERGTERVRYLAQEHSTMSPARAWTQSASAWSGDKCTNYRCSWCLGQIQAGLGGSIETPKLNQPMSKTCRNIKEAQSISKFLKVHDQVTTIFKKGDIDTLTLPNSGGNRISEDTIDPPLLKPWTRVRV